MNTYATEQITRQRIADWHREAQNELLVRPHRAEQARILRGRAVPHGVPNARSRRFAVLRRFAARLAAAT